MGFELFNKNKRKASTDIAIGAAALTAAGLSLNALGAGDNLKATEKMNQRLAPAVTSMPAGYENQASTNPADKPPPVTITLDKQEPGAQVALDKQGEGVTIDIPPPLHATAYIENPPQVTVDLGTKSTTIETPER